MTGASTIQFIIFAATCLSTIAGCVGHPSMENQSSQVLITSEYDNLDSAIANPLHVSSLLLQDGEEWYGFPEEILTMINFEKLTIHMDSIDSIPDEIDRLQKLKELNLPYDLIRYVPPTIGDLDSLEDLNLLANFIEELPVTICNLHKLKTLNLHANYLKSLPECICELKNLELLAISYMPNDPHIDSIEYQRIKTCLPNCGIVYYEVE